MGREREVRDNRRLHYVELDENFGQEHTRARREARRREPSFLSDDEGLKRRSRSAVGHAPNGSDYEVEGYLAVGVGGGEAEVNGLVFGAFEEDRLNLKHFKDKYFLQPSSASSGTGRNAEAVGGGRSQKRSDTGEHPQQLKSQSTDIPKRTQYATLKFNEVNI